MVGGWAQEFSPVRLIWLMVGASGSKKLNVLMSDRFGLKKEKTEYCLLVLSVYAYLHDAVHMKHTTRKNKRAETCSIRLRVNKTEVIGLSCYK